uniref:C-type lectin domain-containing protein n=1 Tax=Magallana gigas TaxID=29159 RepID=A0A8W8NZ06_MAGGI
MPFGNANITGWETFINSEYFVGLDAVTWNEAKGNCTIKGTQLVEVESSEENTFILTMAVKMTKSVWLGGTDHQVEGKWVWQSTNSELSYSAWEKISGQPNNLNNQDCLCLDRSLGFAWSDRECWYRYQYFCERELFTDS